MDRRPSGRRFLVQPSSSLADVATCRAKLAGTGSRATSGLDVGPRGWLDGRKGVGMRVACLTDTRGSLMWVSPRLESILGDITGRRHGRLRQLPGWVNDVAAEAWLQAMDTKRVVPYEIEGLSHGLMVPRSTGVLELYQMTPEGPTLLRCQVLRSALTEDGLEHHELKDLMSRLAPWRRPISSIEAARAVLRSSRSEPR